MRGPGAEQWLLFSTSQTGDFVPEDHPLQRVRGLLDDALNPIHGALTVSYSHTGRPSISPERLIRALPLQVLFSIRSERQMIEQLRYNILYRWFVGLSLDDAVWSATTFTKNRERFVDHQMIGRLLDAVIEQARRRRLLSEQHFCVDGTLIDAWASMGSYRRKDDDDEPPRGPSDFKGQRRRSDTHECKTDPDARLYRKGEGQPARLCYIGHVLTDKRYARVVDAETTHASGTAEVNAALTMLDRGPGKRPLTVGADKNYDQRRFIQRARKVRVTPHVAQNTNRRRSCIDRRPTRHVGYARFTNDRHRVETRFGWGKLNRPLRQTMLRGLDRVAAQAKLVFASYNLVRHCSTGGGMSAFQGRTAPEIRDFNDVGAKFDQDLINGRRDRACWPSLAQNLALFQQPLTNNVLIMYQAQLAVFAMDLKPFDLSNEPILSVKLSKSQGITPAYSFTIGFS